MSHSYAFLIIFGLRSLLTLCSYQQLSITGSSCVHALIDQEALLDAGIFLWRRIFANEKTGFLGFILDIKKNIKVKVIKKVLHFRFLLLRRINRGKKIVEK